MVPGDEISLRFVMAADGFNNFDGFYFDDLALYLTDSLLTDVQTISDSRFRIGQSYPNPARDYAFVEIEKAGEMAFSAAKLLVVNALGQTIWEQTIDKNAERQTLKVNTAGWESGIYFYQVIADGKRTAPRRFCVTP